MRHLCDLACLLAKQVLSQLSYTPIPQRIILEHFPSSFTCYLMELSEAESIHSRADSPLFFVFCDLWVPFESKRSKKVQQFYTQAVAQHERKRSVRFVPKPARARSSHKRRCDGDWRRHCRRVRIPGFPGSVSRHRRKCFLAISRVNLSALRTRTSILGLRLD